MIQLYCQDMIDLAYPSAIIPQNMPLLSELDGQAARAQAERNMDVDFQMAILAQERNIFYDHLVETKTFFQNRITNVLEKENAEGRLVGKTHIDGWINCGSGIATLPNSSEVRILDEIEGESIPHWFIPQAPGHGKKVILADIKGQFVAIQTGRVHIYDTDLTPRQLRMMTAPLVVAKGLGVDWIITTNAAGALDNFNISVGDVVVDVDYVNQFAVNPLIGPNDKRLGTRFPGKGQVVDPYIYERLTRVIPKDNLKLGIYTLSSQSPMYEGLGDLVRGYYAELLRINPELVQLFGMSMAFDAMVLQHFNEKPMDENGFDRPVRWIALSAATNKIPPPQTPTRERILKRAVPNPNPTNEEEVLSGGQIAEKILIPGVIKLCESFTDEPLPAWTPN